MNVQTIGNVCYGKVCMFTYCGGVVLAESVVVGGGAIEAFLLICTIVLCAMSFRFLIESLSLALVIQITRPL